MSEPAVLVTGATGTVGGSVVESLTALGVPVVAAVRGNGNAERFSQSVTQRSFDFGSPPTTLEHILDGVDSVFLMRPPAIENVQRYLFPLIDAAQRRGVRQIVFLSLQGVQGNRKTPHYAVEQYVRSLDMPFTFLRPNFFMQNLSTTYANQIRRTGEIFIPAGRSRTAFIDARDIGRVAATVLTQPGHLRKAYTLSGEQSLSYRQVAEIMSDVLRRPIRYTRPTEAAYLSQLAKDGYPQGYIDVQKMIYRVVRANVSAFPNRQVRKLTGLPATTFRQFVSDHTRVWDAE